MKSFYLHSMQACMYCVLITGSSSCKEQNRWLCQCFQNFLLFLMARVVFVLVITCLGGQFGINCLSKSRTISNFSKITRVLYPKNWPKQTGDYWLITPNQQTLCIGTNIFNSRQLQISEEAIKKQRAIAA